MPILITGLFAPSGGAGAFDLYAPEDIQAGSVNVVLQAIAGGSFKAGSHATSPAGEIVAQVKTTTGAPTHSASLGTLCWNSVDLLLYLNNNGSTGWTAIGSGSGSVGPMGPPGLDGADGEPGLPIPGAQGIQGVQGSAGTTGVAGPIGPPGSDGDEGEPGPPIPGPTGVAGAQGPQGNAGPAGASVMGPPGCDGEEGEPGMSIPGPAGAAGAGGGGGTSIADADADTKVQTEEAADEDIIRMDVAGTERVVLKNVSPHLTITGDLDVSAHAAMGSDATPITTKVLNLIETISLTNAFALYAVLTGSVGAGGQATYGLGGGVIAAGTPSYAIAYGLYFYAQHATPSPCGQLGGILIQVQSAVAGSGALAIARGLYVSAAYWGGSKPITVYGVDIAEQGGAGTGTAFGIRIADQTATTVYLLEIGTTPYLRLVGGAAPGAGLTHLWLYEGTTPLLRNVGFAVADAGGHVPAGAKILYLV